MTTADTSVASIVSAQAGERFRTIDEPRIAACADDAPFSPDELESYVAAGQAWVAVEGPTVVGYLIADIVDGCAHIEEVDVLPSAGGRGHGVRLIETVTEWALSAGLAGVTLTTFRDVPWNAPWYSRRGFRVLSDQELTAGLHRLRALEERHGLPAELRVVMRFDFADAAAPPTQRPGQATLVECWRALARLSPGARIVHLPGTVAAAFPSWVPLNNAIVLAEGEHAAQAAATRAASLYEAAGVGEWALWVPSPVTDLETPDVISSVNSLARDTTTLVMQATLSSTLRPHDGVVETSIESLERVSADEPLRAQDLGAPDEEPGLSAWVMVQDGIAVTTTWSFIHGTDCGIYAVETLPAWRRRGLARALVQHVLHDARERGAQTASLQSTAMGQPLYEALSFEAVGRYEEWVST